MRLVTPAVNIRGIKIGARHPIAIQSMTNTNTANAKATAAQCMQLADAGAELVRIAVDDEKAAKSIPAIRKILDNNGYKHLPLIGDFHYNGHELLKKFPACTKILDKYRINPGNVGYGKKYNENFTAIIRTAIKCNKPIRIGVNSGSLKNPTIKNMVKTALNSAKFAEKLGLKQNKIVLSVKTSSVQETIKAYELLAEKMQKHPYALHLGLTEAGSDLQGIVSSSAALAILLQKGIGDAIRVSLTPFDSRAKEVEVCKAILQALNLRHFQPQIISCPGCGRTNAVFFQKMAQKINALINKKLNEWQKKYPKIVNLKIAIMGCVVNGPGESRHADIAISLPGKNEKPIAQVYIKGKFFKILTGKNISNQFMKILSKYIVNL